MFRRVSLPPLLGDRWCCAYVYKKGRRLWLPKKKEEKGRKEERSDISMSVGGRNRGGRESGFRQGFFRNAKVGLRESMRGPHGWSLLSSIYRSNVSDAWLGDLKLNPAQRAMIGWTIDFSFFPPRAFRWKISTWNCRIDTLRIRIDLFRSDSKYRARWLLQGSYK